MGKQKIIINANEAYEISYNDGTITFQQWTEQLFRWLSIQKNLSKDGYVRVVGSDTDSELISSEGIKKTKSGTYGTHSSQEDRSRIYGDKDLSLKILKVYYEGDWKKFVEFAKENKLEDSLIRCNSMELNHIIQYLRKKLMVIPKDFGLKEWGQKKRFDRSSDSSLLSNPPKLISYSDKYPQLGNRAKLLEIFANYISFRNPSEAVKFLNTIGLGEIFKNPSQFYALLRLRAKKLGISSLEIHATRDQIKKERGQK